LGRWRLRHVERGRESESNYEASGYTLATVFTASFPERLALG